MNNKYFLLMKDKKTFAGQEFKKGEVLYKITNIEGDTVYVDPRNSLRHLSCADTEVSRVYSRDDIDTILNIARGFIKNPDLYDKFSLVVEKKMG